ncbi:MAG: flavin reductase [Bacteroidales bacterium]|nr:flavin reductase [Bacteroidales bacterium]
MKEFKKISVNMLRENAFKLIGSDWMLITAGNIGSFNTMTASWGTIGVLWNKNIAICYIRPHRYTFRFMEENEYYTLSFFEPAHKDKLSFCGSHSGKDTDKIKATGLKPAITEFGNITFEQARLVLECKKIYEDTINPEKFIDLEIPLDIYPQRDFHKFYIGEIMNCYIKD